MRPFAKLRGEIIAHDISHGEFAEGIGLSKSAVSQRLNNLRACAQYNDARVRMGSLVNEIYKEHSPLGKLRLALEFVELTVGEDGLAKRNLSENYLEVKQNG